MLKKRLIATLIVREGIVVQSLNFRRYLPVGDPAIAIEFLNSWGIDEIVVLDITASKDRTRKNFDFVERISAKCFIPLTVGGGIDSMDDIHRLLHLGADKISVNTHALAAPDFITQAAQVFGSQCIIVSIDAVRTPDAKYKVFNAAKGVVTDLDPVEWAKEAEQLGAGEIYLTSVDQDGSKAGFDLNLINQAAESVRIPVIASGGAGHVGHIREAFLKTSASAVSAANFFHFTEHSVIGAKAVLLKSGVGIRLNTHADYTEHPRSEDFRLVKQSEDHLKNLLFEKIEKEVI